MKRAMIPANEWKLVEVASETIRDQGKEYLSDSEVGALSNHDIRAVVEELATDCRGLAGLDWAKN
jgi:hypothetical protein